MPRWFFVVVTLFGLAGAASWIATATDPLGTVVARLGEGGLWTGIAVSVVVAAILGFLLRRDGGGARPPRA